jgi:hypothetical protein
MREQIEAQVAEADEQRRKDPTHYTGSDWWQLSPEEGLVFGIDPQRWPRMMVALTAYNVFLDVTGGDTLGFDEEAVKRLQLERPDLIEGTDPQAFTEFATTYAGLTLREAGAAYWKNRFWLSRQGLTTFPDET